MQEELYCNYESSVFDKVFIMAMVLLFLEFIALQKFTIFILIYVF